MLVLVGSGEYLPPIVPVDRWLLEQLPEPRRVVCLPTAAGYEGAQRVAYWSMLGEEHFLRLGVEVEALPVIDRPSANNPVLVERIRFANFVYLSGGWPNYLLNVLRDSLAWQAILDIHRAGGVVAGCSAGAMIMGERIPGFPGWTKAFNLVNNCVIAPHFEEIPPVFTRTIQRFIAKDRTLLGIEGSTALVQDNGRYQVLGLGGVTIWNRRGRLRFGQGDEVVWP